jgi:hypothetical protein
MSRLDIAPQPALDHQGAEGVASPPDLALVGGTDFRPPLSYEQVLESHQRKVDIHVFTLEDLAGQQQRKEIHEVAYEHMTRIHRGQLAIHSTLLGLWEAGDTESYEAYQEGLRQQRQQRLGETMLSEAS